MEKTKNATLESFDGCKCKNDDKKPILSDNKPIIEILVGLPGSGKSTYSKAQRNFAIHSSDALREELFGDENCQDNNSDLFTILHSRIKEDLLNGKNVIYDATNISKKRRTAFLAELKNIPCHKKCVIFVTPYEKCLEFNSNRERKVPDDVIKRMYMNWCPPDYAEGFDEIGFIYNYGDNAIRMKYTYTYLFNSVNGIDLMSQENSHHRLTLGAHCRAAKAYIERNHPEDQRLQLAALFHDNGKVFTKTRLNTHGIDDGQCHYYQHHCVGAYDFLLYADAMGISEQDAIYVSNLIYFHMHPFMSWDKSEKSRDKAIKSIGQKMYNDIMELHAADLAAH